MRQQDVQKNGLLLGHSRGLHNQNVTVSTVCYELMILLQPNLVDGRSP